MFVCEIPEGVTEADLWTLCGAVGEVEDVSVISAKGFSFVRFADESHAMYAISQLDNHLLPSGAGHAGGRIRVKWTRKKVQAALAPSSYAPFPMPGTGVGGGAVAVPRAKDETKAAADTAAAAEDDNEDGRRLVSYDDDFLFD